MPARHCVVRVQLPRRLHAKLRAQAKSRSADVNELIIAAIAADLAAARRPRQPRKPPMR
jgi:hypothetical protein